MIKSKVNIKSDLVKFLTNPASVTEDLAKLEAKEVRVKALIKELYEGKAKKAFLEACEAKTAETVAEVEKVSKEASEASEAALKKIAAGKAEIVSHQVKLSEEAKKLQEDRKANNLLSASVKKREVAVEKDLVEAAAEKEKYLKLRGEYEEKLANLKAKFELV